MIYTLMYLMLCISSLTVFLIGLILLILIVYILRKYNESLVTIEIFYSFGEHDFMISYRISHYLIILYSNFERNNFVLYYVSLM